MKPSQAKNLYEMLEISKSATSEEIDVAFRKKAFIWHPDKNLDDAASADAEFKILLDAYGILSNPEKRQDYDRYRYKKAARQKFSKFQNERLRIYRESKRRKINKLLAKNRWNYKLYNSISRCSLLGMAASLVGSIATILYYAWIDRGNTIGLSIFLPFLFFNFSLIGYMISRIQIHEIRKRNRSLVIKLYYYVDE